MNVEMLPLSESFKILGDDSYLLDETVALIKATGVIIVSTFRDRRPAVEIEDKSLDDNLSSLAWFNAWESYFKTQQQ